MRMVQQGTPLVSGVWSTEASASWRFLKYYFYGSFNPFLAACLFLGGCPLLGGFVMGVSAVHLLFHNNYTWWSVLIKNLLICVKYF